MDADTYRVTLNWTCGTRNVSNVMHFQQQGSDGSSLAEFDAARGISGAFVDNWIPLVSQHCTFTSIVVQCIHPTPRQKFVYSVGVPGTSTAEPLPPGAATVINFMTENFTRRGRGLIHLVGLALDSIQNANIQDATVSGINTAFAIILGNITCPDGLVVRAGLFSNILHFLPITYATLNTAIRTMRKRR